jgi:hypothetical protein
MTHFTEAILAASKARAARLCRYNKQRARRLAAKCARPSGWGVSGRRGRCGAPDAPHRPGSSLGHRAYPGDPIHSHEMVHKAYPHASGLIEIWATSQVAFTGHAMEHKRIHALVSPVIAEARHQIWWYRKQRDTPLVHYQ